MRVVVAIGGNALIRAGEAGTWEQQLANAREIAEEIVALHAAGHELLLTHGNTTEQVAGSAIVAGDQRDAVVRATLAALNRRLESLLS